MQTGQYYRDKWNTILREQYKNGCGLLAFDLTSQMDLSEVSFELIKHGNIRIEIHFATATACTLTVIMFAKNDNLLEIDQDRNVAFDYMNTLQIERLLRNEKIFKKVCPFNQLEKPVFPSAYIINSDPSNEPREHWIAVYFDKRGQEEYFDSYGLAPAFVGLESYVHRHLFPSWLDLQSQNLTSLIFERLQSLLCILYFISLSRCTFACYCI